MGSRHIPPYPAISRRTLPASCRAARPLSALRAAAVAVVMPLLVLLAVALAFVLSARFSFLFLPGRCFVDDELSPIMGIDKRSTSGAVEAKFARRVRFAVLRFTDVVVNTSSIIVYK